MATYHICDLCGKDMKFDTIFYLSIGQEYFYHRLPSINDIRNTTNFERDLPNKKELCEDCAKVWIDNFNKLDELKGDPDWEAKIYSPKYEDVNSELHYNDNVYKMEVSKYR